MREPLRWHTNAVCALLTVSSGDMHLPRQRDALCRTGGFLLVYYNIKSGCLSTIFCAIWKKRENPQKDSGSSGKSKKTEAKAAYRCKKRGPAGRPVRPLVKKLRHGPVKKRYDLHSGAGCVGREVGVGRSFGGLIFKRPADGSCVVQAGGNAG